MGGRKGWARSQNTWVLGTSAGFEANDGNFLSVFPLSANGPDTVPSPTSHFLVRAHKAVVPLAFGDLIKMQILIQ